MTKIAVLTAGHIHTPGFAENMKKRVAAGEIEIKGVYDQNKPVAEKWASFLGVPVLHCFTEALKDDSVKAVVITGTTAQHDHLAVSCAKAGKHMFIEKPLATTPAEAWRIYTAVKESGVIFQTGHFRRSEALNRFIKQEIDAGNLGTITRARHTNCHSGALGGWFDKEYRWFFQKDQGGGGGLMDLGCHSLDILVYWFGPVEKATAMLAPQNIKYSNIDEYGEAIVKHKNGVVSTFAGSWVDVSNPVILEVSGTEGHLHVQYGKLYYKSSRTKVAGADGKTPIDFSGLATGLPHAFDLFFEVLAGKQDKSVLVPIDDALNVALAMNAAYEGHRLGCWVNV